MLGNLLERPDGVCSRAGAILAFFDLFLFGFVNIFDDGALFEDMRETI